MNINHACSFYFTTACSVEPNLLQNLPILLFRTAFKYYLFCSQTAPICLGLCSALLAKFLIIIIQEWYNKSMYINGCSTVAFLFRLVFGGHYVALDAAAFQTQLLAASATKEASTGHCQRFIGKLSNSLSRSHTLWLSRSSSLAATRSLSFRRRIRSDLTFPGEIRGPRRLQSVQKRNQLTRPSRLTAFSASTGCLAVFDSRMLCHSFPQGPNARSLRTSSDCAAADASTWTWQLARACTWAHIIFCSRCAAPYFAGIMLAA